MNPWPLPLLAVLTACSIAASVPVSSALPEPSVAAPVRDPALDLVPDCRPDACTLSGSVDRADGSRVVVIDGLPDLGLAQVLLVRGGALLDVRELDSEFTEGLRTDTTGNLLVIVNGNTATDIVPLKVAADRLAAVPLRGSPEGMYGDNNYDFVDHAGVLAVVTGRHQMLVTGVVTATVTWTWDGTAYVEGPCVGDRAACS